MRSRRETKQGRGMYTAGRGAGWAPQGSGEALLRGSLSGKRGWRGSLWGTSLGLGTISDLLTQPHNQGEVSYSDSELFVCKMGMNTHVQLQMVIYKSQRKAFCKLGSSLHERWLVLYPAAWTSQPTKGLNSIFTTCYRAAGIKTVWSCHKDK